MFIKQNKEIKNLSINYDGDKLSFVYDAIYLGMYINSDLKWDCDIKVYSIYMLVI